MSSTGLVTEAPSTPDRQTWHQVPGLPSRHSLVRVTIVRDGGLLCVPVQDPESMTGG